MNIFLRFVNHTRVFSFRVSYAIFRVLQASLLGFHLGLSLSLFTLYCLIWCSPCSIVVVNKVWWIFFVTPMTKEIKQTNNEKWVVYLNFEQFCFALDVFIEICDYYLEFQVKFVVDFLLANKIDTLLVSI